MVIRGYEVHPGTPWVWRERSPMWPVETCSFCGSVTPELLLRWLSSGNGASGTDWKYGWPHKFYVNSDNGQHWKFYTEHIGDIDDEVLSPLLDQIDQVLGVHFEFDTLGRLNFKAPAFGHQGYRVHPVDTNV